MKIGYNEATAMKKSSLDKDLALTEKYGYDYIEIRLDMLEQYTAAGSIKELARFFAGSRVKPYALNAIEEINFLDDASFRKVAEQVKRACEAAEIIDNPYLIVVPSFRNSAAAAKSEGEIEEDSIAVLNRLADISEGFNVKIAFEPVGFKTCTVKSMGQAWNIVKKAGRDSIGLVIDAFNVYLFNGLEDIDVLEDIDMEKLFVFHIDDCEGGIPIGELQLSNRMWPGDGVIPLKDMLSIFYKKGFDKIASVELFRPEYWELPPEVAIKLAKEKTEKVINMYYR